MKAPGLEELVDPEVDEADEKERQDVLNETGEDGEPDPVLLVESRGPVTPVLRDGPW